MTMMTEYDHFREGMHRLRDAFDRAGVHVVAIELATPDDGCHLLGMIPLIEAAMREPWLRENGEAGGALEFEGIKIRWPTQRLALPRGGWKDIP